LTQGVNRLCAIGALPPNDGGRCRQAQSLVSTQTIAVNNGEMYRSFAAAGTSGFDFTGDQHQIDISGFLRAFGHRLQFRSAGHLDHKSRVPIRDGAREGDRLPPLKFIEGEAGRSPRVDLGPVSRPPDTMIRCRRRKSTDERLAFVLSSAVYTEQEVLPCVATEAQLCDIRVLVPGTTPTR